MGNTWEKVFGFGTGYRGIQTHDGGFVMAGIKRINFDKIYVLRINSLGDTLWSRIYGSLNLIYAAYWIEETNDRGFIITGSGPGSDVCLLKTDSLGNEMWFKTYGGSELDQGLKVVLTSDNGYLIGGRTYSFGGGLIQQLYLIKTDSSGNLQWQKVYGSDLLFTDLIVSKNSGYCLMGVGNMTYLFRINNNGDTIYSRQIQGVSNGIRIKQLSDYSMIIGGDYLSASNYNSALKKTDSSGNLQWERLYSHIGDEGLYDLVIRSDSRFLMVGFSDSLRNSKFRALLRIVDQNGNVLQTKLFNANLADYRENSFRSISITGDGGIFCSGFSRETTTSKVYAVLTDSIGNLNPTFIDESNNLGSNFFKLYANYPNPFNPVTTLRFDIAEKAFVEIEIYNLKGQEVSQILKSTLTVGHHEVLWDAYNFETGIYFCIYKIRSVNESSSFSQKILLIK